ncbi:putative N-acetyltransferase CML5 Camello-like protein 5 [Burkholderiales bacterium]|nr:putative N-acetyltransferase CML5 Camello-like protein 5 [Burkholderiales bacterium]
MSDIIYPATTASDYDAFAGLVREYIEWARMRYRDHPWVIDQVLSHQSFETELQTLPACYGPPNGGTLLVQREGRICGCGAYRRLSGTACEMKRLFVPDRYRGHGTGRRLCEAINASARDAGYTLMRLDTGNLFTEAIAMYQSMGFRTCAPHHAYPEKLLPYVVFMELPLAGG